MTTKEKKAYIKEMVSRLPGGHLTRHLKVKKVGHKWVHLADISEGGSLVTIELDHCIALLDENEHLMYAATN